MLRTFTHCDYYLLYMLISVIFICYGTLHMTSMLLQLANDIADTSMLQVQPLVIVAAS